MLWKTGVEPEKRETEHGCLFPVADGGGACYYDAVRMDDEMPLKREDLRERAEEKAAGNWLQRGWTAPRNGFRAYPGEKVLGKEWMKSLSACEVYGMRLAPAGPTCAMAVFWILKRCPAASMLW